MSSDAIFVNSKFTVQRERTVRQNEAGHVGHAHVTNVTHRVDFRARVMRVLMPGTRKSSSLLSRRYHGVNLGWSIVVLLLISYTETPQSMIRNTNAQCAQSDACLVFV